VLINHSLVLLLSLLWTVEATEGVMKAVLPVLSLGSSGVVAATDTMVLQATHEVYAIAARIQNVFDLFLL
jgi:hypothetical protein